MAEEEKNPLHYDPERHPAANPLHYVDPRDLTEEEAFEALRSMWPDEHIERLRKGRTYVQLFATWQRFTSPLGFLHAEHYTADGSLIVGKGYVVFTPEKRRRGQARDIANEYAHSMNDNRLLIGLGLISEPENETDKQRAKRLLETRMLAYELAGQGDFSVAIELGYLPKPKVEPQPRMVDTDGNLVQEAVAIKF